MTQTKYYGKAYAFFDCSASKEEIEAELPKIRHVTRTPSKLELSLFKGVEVFNMLKRTSEVRALAREFNDAKYVLEAKCPGKSNQETADQLAGVLNQAYQSPLYQEGENFSGSIVYRRKGKYEFR